MKLSFRKCEEATEARAMVHRDIRVRSNAKAVIRQAKFNDRDHLVISVVALMEGVVWPSNASAPEYVSAKCLQQVPASWNGRPCVPDHPENSANEPSILEGEAFGQVFNSTYKDGKLLMEAWLDIARCKALKGLPEKVLKRAQAGKPIEVSVGAFVQLEKKEGEFNGKKYKAEWVLAIPDHLAMLPEGTIGACSNEMGCGAPRSARVHVLEETGFRAACEHEQDEEPEDEHRSLRERFKALFSFNQRDNADGMSDGELRRKLRQLTRDVEPGFLDVDDVWHADMTYMYTCVTEDKWRLYTRSFAQEGVTVSLGDDRQEVQPRVTFEPVAASSCGCGGTEHTTCGCEASVEETQMKTKAERISALIAHKGTKFTETDRPKLEALSEDVIGTIEGAIPEEAAAPVVAPPVAAPVAPVVAPVAAPVALAAKTDAEIEAAFLADPNTPQSLKTALLSHKTQQTARHAQLVNHLKGAQKTFTEAQLQVKSIESLEEMYTLLASVAPSAQQLSSVGAVDFGLQMPAPRQNADGPNSVPAPPDMIAQIRQNHAKKQ